MANLRDKPTQLWSSPRCGARTRSGAPCRSPAVKGRPKCRMHGCAPGSGGKRGRSNGRWKHGRFSAQAKEVSAFFRGMAKDGEALVARVMHKHGLRPPRGIRRKAHVRRALKKVKEEGKA
jgi:hypothetical protein